MTSFPNRQLTIWVVGKPAAQDNKRKEVNQMKTILVIEFIVMYQVFIVGVLFWC